MVCSLCAEFKLKPVTEDCFRQLLSLLEAHYEKSINCRRQAETGKIKIEPLSLDTPDNVDHVSLISDDASQPLFASQSSIKIEEQTFDDEIIMGNQLLLQPEAPKKRTIITPTKSPSVTITKWTRKSGEKQKTATKENANTKIPSIRSYLIKRNLSLDKSTSFGKGSALDGSDTDPDRTFFDFEPKQNSSVKKTKRLCLKPLHQPKSTVLFDKLCDECKEYITALGVETDADEMKQRLAMCEKHKKKKYKLHDTPEGFWNPRFPPTPEDRKTQLYIFKSKE